MQQKVAVKQRANDCSYSDTCGASGETLSLKPFLHTRLLGFNKSFIECFKNLKFLIDILILLIALILYY